MQKILTSFCIIILFSSAVLSETKSNNEEFTGPLLGNVTSNSVSIWLYTAQKCKVSVFIWEKGEKSSFMKTKVLAGQSTTSNLHKGHYYIATLENLKTYTDYQYQVEINGKTEENLKGQFRTAPIEGSTAKFRMATSSCVRANPDKQKSWLFMVKQAPDFHIMLGDSQYADSTKPEKQWSAHLQIRKFTEVAKVYRNIPTYSIWDDHDFGPNDSDGTTAGKKDSLKTWKQMWVNPGYGTQKIPGAFYRFKYADVEFFVVDGRYSRSPNKMPDNNRNKTMLGNSQFEWLINGLKESTAKFKLIASGSTWSAKGKDCWSQFPNDRKRFLKAINENKISGVLYLSGDLHKSMIVEHDHKKMIYPIGYPFVELISSGIGNSKDKKYSFMILDFDTTLEDPQVKVSIIAQDEKQNQKVDQEKTFRLSTLTHN